MAEWWDDYSDFSLGGGDTLDMGSWNQGDYAGFSLTGGEEFGAQPMSMGGFGNQTMPTAAGQLQDPAAGYVGFGTGGTMGGFSGGTPIAPTPTQPNNDIFGMNPNLLAALLGTGGSLAAILGTVAAKGTKATETKQGTSQETSVKQATPGPEQTAIGQQAQQAISGLQPAAQGQLPLQQEQAALLTGLASGQIPQAYIDLVARAYDPQYQDAARRSVEAGRQAGFHDAPLSSPPGGAIMGPAAAQLQGQQANSLLGIIQSLPGLYNQPVSNQINAQGNMATGFGNLFSQYMPTATQTASGTGATSGSGQTGAPLASTLGTAIGSGLQGLGQNIAQNQQQQSLDAILAQMKKGEGGITMSGTKYA